MALLSLYIASACLLHGRVKDRDEQRLTGASHVPKPPALRVIERPRAHMEQVLLKGHDAVRLSLFHGYTVAGTY